MNRPYQFYYFVPLVSFWFMVMYVTMVLWPQVSEKSTEGKRIFVSYQFISDNVVTLCFVMNRPYQFYYFVPLMSFLFMVMYVTMVLMATSFREKYRR